MSEFLGALHRIGVFTREETHLMVYDDALVMAVSDDSALVLAAAIGLGLGGVMAERIRKRGEAQSPEDIAAGAAKNRLIPISTVESAKLSRSSRLFRQLRLILDDGTEETLKWQRGDNKDDWTVELLQKALGEKLSVELGPPTPQ